METLIDRFAKLTLTVSKSDSVTKGDIAELISRFDTLSVSAKREVIGLDGLESQFEGLSLSTVPEDTSSGSIDRDHLVDLIYQAVRRLLTKPRCLPQDSSFLSANQLVF